MHTLNIDNFIISALTLTVVFFYIARLRPVALWVSQLGEADIYMRIFSTVIFYWALYVLSTCTFLLIDTIIPNVTPIQRTLGYWNNFGHIVTIGLAFATFIELHKENKRA